MAWDWGQKVTGVWLGPQEKRASHPCRPPSIMSPESLLKMEEEPAAWEAGTWCNVEPEGR